MKNMWKYVIPILSLILVGCQKHDAYYYASHPKVLEQALNSCLEESKEALSCDELQAIASKMRQLTYQLQDNQLAYGQKILALQEQADSYQQQLAQHPTPALLHSLKLVQEQIQAYLLPVQWLESPRSRS